MEVSEEDMMTKATILRCLAEMESKLAELRAAVEQWPAVPQITPTAELQDLEREGSLGEAKALREVFATLRAAWNIPPDVEPVLPLEELQKAMAEGLPENWASREVMRMREE